MNDLVSVIMPSYNTADYIGDSIRSVLAQTYKNWELLIVDDCSKDNTDEVVASFADARIRYLKNERNSGAALSRNRALREAKGRWIAFLDSDDMWDAQKLELQVAFMEKHGYAFTFTDYRVQVNGHILPYLYIGPDVVNKRKIYDYCYFSTITVMYDRDAVGLVQIENLRKNNDYAMWLQIAEKVVFYRFPECLSTVVKRENSVSSGSKLKLIKWHYRLFHDGLHKNAAISAVLTVNNLVHGVIKKIRYRVRISEEE